MIPRRRTALEADIAAWKAFRVTSMLNLCPIAVFTVLLLKVFVTSIFKVILLIRLELATAIFNFYRYSFLFIILLMLTEAWRVLG